MLEQLYAAAAATAVVTIALNLVLAWIGLKLPDWIAPASGFIVAFFVSGAGYLVVRRAKHDRLHDAAQAATNLLDWSVGNLSDGRFAPASFRDLAQFAMDDRLVIGLSAFTGYVAHRLDEYVDAFERATSHSAGELVPPRANGAVARTIRQLRAATVAIGVFESQLMQALSTELRYDRPARRKALAPYVQAVADPLLAGIGAAEELEELADAKASRAASKTRKGHAAAAARTRIELQKTTAAAGLELLANATPGQLDRSTLARADAIIRDIAGAGRFAFVPEIEEDALTAWRQRIAGAMAAFIAPIEGRGYEMDPATNRGWVDANDGARQLDNGVQSLLSVLEGNRKLAETDRADPAIAERTEERRGEVQARAKLLVEAVDELRSLEVR